MRKLLGVALLALTVTSGPALSAEPPKFQTTFRFEVHFSDSVQTYNENLGINVTVWLPPEQPWQCSRPPPSIVTEGRRRGSFACSNDGWKTSVLTMVGCRVDAVDPQRIAAMRLFGPGPPQTADAGPPPLGKFVDLTVSCETTRVP